MSYYDWNDYERDDYEEETSKDYLVVYINPILEREDSMVVEVESAREAIRVVYKRYKGYVVTILNVQELD
ncbi:MAG: hypothetical protein E7362_00485 [Clostridiales bacterium]|nr:hypothetical protein [Clostridiales bacterium]